MVLPDFHTFSVMCMRDFSYLPKFHTFLGRRRGWSAWKDGRSSSSEGAGGMAGMAFAIPIFGN